MVAVPAALVSSTSKAAALVVAGQLTAAAPAVVLMKGVMKVMLLKKLRLVVGAVMVMVAFGAIGLGYRAGGTMGAAQAAPPDKPKNELETLRRENELLKLNLEVVLEKVRAQEAELRTLRSQRPPTGRVMLRGDENPIARITIASPPGRDFLGEATKEAEAAIKVLREAKDNEGRKRATEALEKALQKLKQSAGGPAKP
jgi:hypothetical protein